MIKNVLVLLITFCAMEGVAWLAHRFVMHGPLWWFHRDHHNHEPGFFEKNDFFFLLFALPSVALIYSGLAAADIRLWIGLGIALYGMCYSLVHDILIHQRIKWLGGRDSVYITAIRKAHLVHHRHLGPEDGECFGMLTAPPRYFREARKTVATRKRSRKRGRSS